MSDSVDVSKFKIGACAVSYKGTVLGATRGGVKLSMEPEIHETKCDQNSGRVVRRVVTNVALSVQVPLLEVEKGFSNLLDSSGQITTAMVGSDLIAGGGALILTPVDLNDKDGYQFPKAVLNPKFEYSYDAEEDHVLNLEFFVEPDAGGVMMEKIAVNAV